jgi:fatty-acyl-CoA synthase
MVAIVSDGELDLEAFRKHLTTRLPEYACPVFVRLLREIETTSTFKPKKQDLVRLGFDPNETEDALFVNDREAGAFVQLDTALFERIQSGRIRL